eukprot:TRINITY_DN17094_c0_g1_i1.p1 TRINITY_DN17094_c0_g1~~TRINITY_DN17094_c0_g1_i1.p1  ORF type:complete len:444 (-),score=48.39 TRINITY_DN17094_c0_g1_i1:51-1382(-)
MTGLYTPLCANAQFRVFAFALAVFVGYGVECGCSIDSQEICSSSFFQAKYSASIAAPPKEYEQQGKGDLRLPWIHAKIGHSVAFSLALALPLVCFLLYWKSFLQHNTCRDEVGTATAAAASMAGRDITDSRQQPVVCLGSIAVSVYVVLLIATDTLVSHISQASGGSFPWEPAAVVLLVEAAKCAVSAPLPSVIEGQDATPSFSDLLGATVRLAPVAMLYAGNNCLVLYVLSKMQLSSFVIWRNTSILFNAFLWIAYFRRPFSSLQTAGVGFLFLGLVVGEIDADGSVAVPDRRVFLVVFSAFCSAAASVINESVLKGPFGTRTLGINRINTLLYAETSTILAVALVWQSGGNFVGAFSGFDRRVVVLVTAQTALGLCVSRVLVYTDSVTKVMAGGVRELLTILVAPMFVNSRLDPLSLLSGVYIFIAVLSYFVPVVKSNMKR